MNRIGVGIIGASPLNPGWAVIAHIPALRALDQRAHANRNIRFQMKHLYFQ